MKKIEILIEELTYKYFPFTNVIGLSRSILALGLLLTLMTNQTDLLLHKYSDGSLINPILDESVALNKYNFFTVLGLENVIWMKWVGVFILIGVISGYWFKVTAILHWWVSISFLYFSSIIDGGDQIGAILSLLFIPILLFDKRKNHWEEVTPYQSIRNIIPIITIWIIRLQIAIIYFQAAIGKFFVPEWANGTAIYYWWNHSVFGMPLSFSETINHFLSNSFVVSFITYFVMIFEILLFLSLTASVKYRKRILVLGILFHFSIIIFHGIFSFFFSIVAGLIVYLFPTYENINFKKLLPWFQKRLRYLTP